MSTITLHLIFATVVRLILLAFGDWQDQNLEVKYTDIDYHVFSDAAAHVFKGNSPYLRHTYRYTPFLAWMLTPNVYVPSFGKFMFVFFDIAIGYLLYKILRRSGYDNTTSILSTTHWLYNPFTISISTRGSAESVVCFLVIALLYFFQKRMSLMTGLLCGTAIHFKLYAITYCMPIYFSYGEKMHRSYISYYFWPNRERYLFVFGVISSFLALTGWAYSMYGSQFLEEAFFYHLVRKDHRHNFSIYFYLMYITADKPTTILNYLGFLPQLILLVFFSFKFHRHSLIPFAIFCNTYVFVTFNKVLTSQYYVWYLSLLPILTAKIYFGIPLAIFLIALWFGPQLLWLSAAYNLEFMGHCTFVDLWLYAVVLFLCHVVVLCVIIRLYFPKTSSNLSPTDQDGKDKIKTARKKRK